MSIVIWWLSALVKFEFEAVHISDRCRSWRVKFVITIDDRYKGWPSIGWIERSIESSNRIRSPLQYERPSCSECSNRRSSWVDGSIHRIVGGGSAPVTKHVNRKSFPSSIGRINPFDVIDWFASSCRMITLFGDADGSKKKKQKKNLFFIIRLRLLFMKCNFLKLTIY